MSKNNCLDNHSLPHKAFHQIVANQLKKEQTAIRAALTPMLIEAWEAFKSNGRAIAADTACTYKAQMWARRSSRRSKVA